MGDKGRTVRRKHPENCVHKQQGKNDMRTKLLVANGNKRNSRRRLKRSSSKLQEFGIQGLYQRLLKPVIHEKMRVEILYKQDEIDTADANPNVNLANTTLFHHSHWGPHWVFQGSHWVSGG